MASLKEFMLYESLFDRLTGRGEKAAPAPTGQAIRERPDTPVVGKERDERKAAFKAQIEDWATHPNVHRDWLVDQLLGNGGGNPLYNLVNYTLPANDYYDVGTDTQQKHAEEVKALTQEVLSWFDAARAKASIVKPSGKSRKTQLPTQVPFDWEKTKRLARDRATAHASRGRRKGAAAAGDASAAAATDALGGQPPVTTPKAPRRPRVAPNGM